MTDDLYEHLDPAQFLQPNSRLFIDTNVFMETRPSFVGGLKPLFERCAETIRQNNNPIVVPTKVQDELKKNAKVLLKDQPERAAKAANALIFLESASGMGLIRKDLGDRSNPYADDLFLELFDRFATTYDMCLLTFDVTPKIRVRLLAKKTGRRMIAGHPLQNGDISVESDRELYRKGVQKLAEGRGGPREARELESLLAEFRQLCGIHDEANGSEAIRKPAETRRSAAPPRTPASPLAFTSNVKIKPADSRLAVTRISAEGDDVQFENSSGVGTLRLGKLLGEGGEGNVYAVDAFPNAVVKIFDAEHITAHREAKITLMIQRGLERPGICFPSSIIRNQDGQFVGYAMPKAEGKEFQRTIFNPKRFKEAFPNWTKRDLVDVCIAFLEQVIYLHSLNIILGDINPKNLMVDDTKRVFIIDADSWQLEGYPCPVGTPMFTAPSLIGVSYSERLRTVQEENFAIATMLFMILITGQFPYMRKGTDGDMVQLIREGNFAFQYKDRNDRNQPDGDWKFMWSHVHTSPQRNGVKDLFFDTFDKEEGKRYNRRPPAAEWLAAFKNYKTFLASAENFDPMSNDVYPIRSKAWRDDTPIKDCPNCKRKHAIAGIWMDGEQRYSVPRLCNKCRGTQEKCSDCGRPSNRLKDGRCWECDKKHNYAKCQGCGQDKPTKYLVDGRCNKCQMVACRKCGTRTPKSELEYGKCKSCLQKDNQFDPARLCTRCSKPFITFGQIDWHTRNGRTVPTSHRTDDNNCKRAASAPAKRTAATRSTHPVSTATQPAKKSLWQRLFD